MYNKTQPQKKKKKIKGVKVIDFNKTVSFEIQQNYNSIHLFLWSDTIICYFWQTFCALASCVFIATSHIRNEL